MCGLVGFIGEMSESDKRVFDCAMLITNFVRGPDSTGICAVNTKGKVSTFKSLGNMSELYVTEPSHFLKTNSLLKYSGPYLLGHCRKATQGKVNVDNAHPFEFGSIVGAHNGTITDYYLNGFKYKKEYPIDSKVILASLAETPVPEFYENLADSVNSAAALWWYDKSDKTVNILRNTQRTLFYIHNKDKNKLFFASQLDILEAAIFRYGNFDEWVWQKNTVDHSINPHTHYKIQYDYVNKVVKFNSQKVTPKIVTYGVSYPTNSSYKGTVGTASKPLGAQVNHVTKAFPKEVKPAQFYTAKEIENKKDFSSGKLYLWDDDLEKFCWFDQDSGLTYPFRNIKSVTPKHSVFCGNKAYESGNSQIYTTFYCFESVGSLPKPASFENELPKDQWIRLEWDSKSSCFVLRFKNPDRKTLTFSFDPTNFKNIIRSLVRDVRNPKYFYSRVKIKSKNEVNEVPIEDYYTYGEDTGPVTMGPKEAKLPAVVPENKTEKEAVKTENSVVPFPQKKDTESSHWSEIEDDDDLDFSYGGYSASDYWKSDDENDPSEPCFEHEGLQIPYSDFVEYLEEIGGCYSCAEVPTLVADLEKIKWIDSDMFQCPHCSDSSIVSKYLKNSSVH